MIDVPSGLQGERNALIAEIYEAFKGVSREGGVSWNETFAIDDYASDEECRQARNSDPDRSWTELAVDDEWDAGPGSGGWAFLDPIGFRYYLPAAMVRVLRAGHRACSCFTLDMSLTPHDKSKRALFNAEQLRCVAHFVRYMIAWEEAICPECESTTWRRYYEKYWKSMA